MRTARMAAGAAALLLALTPPSALGKVPRKLMQDCGYGTGYMPEHRDALMAACQQDIRELWRSGDPADRSIAADDASEECSKGVAEGCILLRDAYWLGWGEPMDPTWSSLSAGQCEQADDVARWPEREVRPHASCRATGEEIEAAAPRGWKRPSPEERVAQALELAKGVSAAIPNMEGAYLYLTDAERRGLVPDGTTFATLAPLYGEDAPDTTIWCSSVFATQDACESALDRAWSGSDAAEVSHAAKLSIAGCAKSAASCARARDAAWLGYGANLDPVASAAFAEKCEHAPSPPGRPHPGEACHATSEQIEAAAPAGWVKLDGPGRIEAARALLARGDRKGLVLYLADAARRGLVPANTPVDELIAPLAASAPSVAAAVVDEIGAALPGSLPEGRVEEVRRAAREYHADLAKRAAAANATYAARFHAGMAARFGARDPIPEADPLAVLAPLPLRPRPVLPPDCGWASDGASTTLAPTPGGGEVTVDLALQCRRDERRWTTSEDYTWVETETRYRTREIPATSRSVGYDCSYTQTTYDSNGQAHDSLMSKTCFRTETTPASTVQEPYEVSVSRQGTRHVEHRELTVELTGQIRYGSRAPVPVTIRQHLEEEQYSTEHGSSSFSTSDLPGLTASASGELGTRIAAIASDVRREAMEAELAQAKAASDPVLADEHMLRAWLLGAPGGAEWSSRYGLAGDALETLMKPRR